MAESTNFIDSGASNAKHKEYALLSQVAHMYYDLNMQQPEIAEKLYFSRSKVSRMLTQARKLGIVEINVRHIVDRTAPLEKKLCSTFGLTDAVVITSFETESRQDVFQSLTDFAALHISSLIKGKCKVGISNGKTINAVVKKLHRQNPCTLEVVQLIGSTGNTYVSEESRHLVDDVLKTFSGEGYFLNAPMYIDDVYAKEILLRDPAVSDVFDHMRGCGMLLTGVGALQDLGKGVHHLYGYQTQRHVEELRAGGAVGSVCAQYFDIDGKPVESEWNSKCVAMPLEDVRTNSMTIGIATGEAKIMPILGALRGSILNVLITDASTASGVLEAQEELSRIHPEP